MSLTQTVISLCFHTHSRFVTKPWERTDYTPQERKLPTLSIQPLFASNIISFCDNNHTVIEITPGNSILILCNSFLYGGEVTPSGSVSALYYNLTGNVQKGWGAQADFLLCAPSTLRFRLIFLAGGSLRLPIPRIRVPNIHATFVAYASLLHMLFSYAN